MANNDKQKYLLRFNYHINKSGVHWRTTKLWWKPFYWLGNRNWLRFGIDNMIFGTNWGWKIGKVHRWIRKYITYD